MTTCGLHFYCFIELSVRLTARVFRELLCIYIFTYIRFGFHGEMWDLIVL